MTLLLTLTPALQEANQDAWVSVCVGTVLGLLVAFISGRISALYPGETFVKICLKLFGKVFGRIILLPYYVMWYSVIGIILRQATAFLHLALFQQTPIWVLMAVLSLLMLYVNYAGGIESIGRASEVVGPIIVLMVIVVLLLNLNNVDLKHVLPVYIDSGWWGILKGSVAPSSFLGESVILVMTLAFVENPRSASRSAMWGIVLSGLLVVLSTLSVVMTFSTLAVKMRFPFFEMARFISVMDFIQNVDVLVVIVWILSVFIKLSWYLFVSAYGTAEWLSLKTWRTPIWFIVPVALVFGLIFRNNVEASIEYPEKYWMPIVLPVNMVGIPTFVLIWATISKRWKKNSNT